MKKQADSVSKLLKKDEQQIATWMKKPHLVELFQHDQDLKERGGYWLCSHGNHPAALIVAQAAPSEEGALLFCLATLDPHFDKTEEAAAWLTQWMALTKTQTWIGQVPVQQAALVAAYEAAGFTRVASIVKGKGFFKGSPYHIFRRNV